MGKNIFITGAGRGLGYYLTKKFLEEGHTVYGGVRNPDSAGIAEFAAAFPGLKRVRLDVSSTQSVNECAQELKKMGVTLDILVNNAGIQSASSFNTLENTDLDEALEIYNVNSIGPLRVVKAFLPLMNKDSSLIASVSSGAASIGNAHTVKMYEYCMSKAALNMGIKILSNHLRDTGIRQVLVDPGWLDTDMGKRSGGPMDPYESAGKLYRIFTGIGKDHTGPLYVNYDGKAVPW